MKFLIIGAGGIGAYFGARLIDANNDVTFIARGQHYEAIKNNGLKVISKDFNFEQKVNIFTMENFDVNLLETIDLIVLTTKATSTQALAITITEWLNKVEDKPYIISLQNGVENEDILTTYIPQDKVIGAITRKIGAHIISDGVIESTGCADTLIGTLFHTEENKFFLQNLQESFLKANIPTTITHSIKKELWCKLIINNGVNAICALLGEKTGEILSNEKLSQIVYGLMSETVIAAKYAEVTITQKELNDMFELIKKFDSIKPSMLVDVENNRPIELKEICEIVINNCEAQDYDAPYTKTITYLLEFIYAKKLNN